MAAYTTAGTFVDGSDAVPINATNMNDIDQALVDWSTDKYTGNGGQPPAPKWSTVDVAGIPSAAWTTLLTMGTTEGVYAINARYLSDPGYIATANIHISSAGTMGLSNIVNGSVQLRAAPGRVIECYQPSGATLSIRYSLRQIGS